MAEGFQARRESLTLNAIPGMRRPGGAWRGFFSGVWLVYLIQPVAHLLKQPHSPWYIAGALALLVAFCVVYLYVLARWDHSERNPRWGLPVVFVLAAAACLIYGGATWNALWIYVSAGTGVVVQPPKLAFRLVLVVGACFVLFSWIGHDGTTDLLVTLLPTVLVGWAMIGFRRQVMLMRELTRARETVARMAASEERLRLARDMHDLTGQSLSMITLKSELAAKILGRMPEGPDRDRALLQVDEVAAVSRQTLHDIREALSGYRRPTLAIEIITARTALEAAGIEVDDDPRLTTLSGAFDAEAEAALAWCLRESVTNVIRHSAARNCRITLRVSDGETSLEVCDDGHGPAGGPGPAATHSGSGLHGMSDRLGAAGGRLELGAGSGAGGTGTGGAGAGGTGAGGTGFRLVATVPVVPRPSGDRATMLT